MRITILGCGGSGGVPVVGNYWGNCNPSNPKNRRLRTSILVEDGDTTLLVDTTPDMRQQLLNAGVTHLDAVLYTHSHADHVHGIDDLRPLNRVMRRDIDIHATAEILKAHVFCAYVQPMSATIGEIVELRVLRMLSISGVKL